MRSAADPVVLGILRDTGSGEDCTPREGAKNDGVYLLVDATVMRAGGQVFTRRAVVWAGHGQRRGRYLLPGSGLRLCSKWGGVCVGYPVRRMALAWILTLPAAMLFAGSLFVLLRQIF